MRTEFTTYQIAAIAKVSPRTVCGWIDKGRIKGAWRMPEMNGSPGGRRVSRENLIAFFKEIKHVNALATLEGELTCRVLVAAPRSEWVVEALSALDTMGGLAAQLATEPFAAASALGQWRPHLTVIDFQSFGRHDGGRLAEQLSPDAVIAVVAEDDNLNAMQRAYLMARQHPVNPTAFAGDIRKIVEARFGSHVVRVRLNPQ